MPIEKFDVYKAGGMQKVLEGLISHLKSLPNREQYEEYLLYDLIGAYNTYMARYDDISKDREQCNE